ncbi:MFS transporter [Infirmifilum lucidum]|uniref:MFS transporter n=1 Tax=Infirmifilum lucidum TaxID=2776706 RepID=A0A7L9FJ03_9CREN|nr:MFS transporter [Infirmifilum lucidum]QOJ78876.1 MFS transporter [Infirmifilum lucidum]
MSSSERSRAYKLVASFGIVSLLGDIVYEGSRGTIPTYMKHLGASAAVVGTVMGLGELMSYFSRLLGGFLADKTKSYWLLIFLGYGLIIAIPLISLSEILGPGWALAAALVILERLGKGLRTPSRDTIISFASKSIGSGKAFGLHELLDQVGATAGPLFFAGILALTSSYRQAFLYSIIPYALLMATLAYVRSTTALPVGVAERKESSGNGILNREAVAYIVAVFVNSMGLFPASLILYLASEALEFQALGAWLPPVLYAVIQLVDAIFALAFGLLYDRYKLWVLLFPFTLSTLIPLLALQRGIALVALSAVVFGLVLGSQESVYRAAVGDLTEPSVRATAYGLFSTAVGLGSLISGAIYGLMIDLGFPLWVSGVYVVATQAACTFLLLHVARRRRG